MTDGKRPVNIFTLPPEVPFVDALARGLMGQARAQDPLSLSAMTILLPTRRACRALHDAFLRQSEGRATLLPRLAAIADVDEESLLLQSPGALALPPAISPVRRQLLLARLVMTAQEKLSEGRGLSWEQAARLAQHLGAFLDEVHTERVDMARLSDLVPDDYAAHWQVTLDFLKIVTDSWPAVLAEQGVLDPAGRRNKLLEAQAQFWKESPPSTPIIAAGITGTIPAVGDLLEVIAALPMGSIVLPGLDTSLDEDTWQNLDEQHPQYGLAQLLKRLNITRADVTPWDHGAFSLEKNLRHDLLQESFKPSSHTDTWQKLTAQKHTFPADSLKDIQRIDADSEQEEALTIATRMRLDLNTVGKTTVLITPDRQLARRVVSALTRWAIPVDDSAGQPLRQTAPCAFFDALLAWAENPKDPVAWMALLKHPFATGGLSPGTFRQGARRVEINLLRLFPTTLNAAFVFDALSQKADEALRPFLASLRELLEPWQSLFNGTARTLSEWLEAHMDVAQQLAATPTESGVDRLWRRDEGEALASHLRTFKDSARDFSKVTGADYAALFRLLLEGQVVRPRYGRHPRAFILGPLEARLQHFDHMILGGLNEGVWPEEAGVDPWMSRPMRKKFGLPSPEYRVGLAAHDIWMMASGPLVTLTRAQRRQGAPTVPSRWLLRLEAVLKAAGLEYRITQNATSILAHARHLDQPAGFFPAAPPRPSPPVSIRPRRLSVTDIEHWMRDPYGIYAKHILRLRKLLPLVPDLGAAERGQFIHAALEKFVKLYPNDLPADSYEKLLSIGTGVFADHLSRPDVWAFWWPRFENIAAWFVAWEKERRREARFLAAECRGKLSFAAPAGPFHLIAKADRLDQFLDGSVGIVDYKTGALPQVQDVALGFSPQLALEGAIVRTGGFTGIKASAVGRLEYVMLSGRDEEPGQVRAIPNGPNLIDEALNGLKALVVSFDQPSTCYRACPRPSYEPRYNDYEHLARVQEFWH